MLVEHTFDAKCRQSPVDLPDRDGGMPPVKAQFFYSSSVPIDDPLSASSHTATTDFKKYKELLRPFGRGDNNALETAWMSLSNTENRSRHEVLRSGNPKTGSLAQKDAKSREELVQKAAQKHGRIHLGVKRDQSLTTRIAASANEMRDTQEELCCSELLNEIKEQLKHTTCSLARAVDPLFRPEAIATDVSALIRRRQLHQDSEEGSILNSLQSQSSNKNSRTIDIGSRSRPSTPKQFLVDDMRSLGNSQSKRSSWAGGETKFRMRADSQLSDHSNKTNERPRNSATRDGITGNPFARVNGPGAGSDLVTSVSHGQFLSNDSQRLLAQTRPETLSGKHHETKNQHESYYPLATDFKTEELPKAHITVGISRLHLVDLPALQMKPIYWSPVNDVAVVTRSTWFYRQAT
ncbi:hypothetical protein G3M48_001363 [Beauveria asiatica]|uniref:DDHD domain-containing protein n=1 Tax=Beauveria asiatica TaxID=1069075 RepID=A0AAW0RZ65_9HYPO